MPRIRHGKICEISAADGFDVQERSELMAPPTNEDRARADEQTQVSRQIRADEEGSRRNSHLFCSQERPNRCCEVLDLPLQRMNILLNLMKCGSIRIGRDLGGGFFRRMNLRHC